MNPSTGKPWSGEYERAGDLLERAEKYAKELVEAGAFSLDDTYALQYSDFVGGTGSLSALGAGAEVSYREIVRRMICASDNTATNNGEGQDSALNADTTMVEAPAPAPADSMQPADSVKPAEEAKADVKADAAPKAEEPKAEEPKAEEPAK